MNRYRPVGVSIDRRATAGRRSAVGHRRGVRDGVQVDGARIERLETKRWRTDRTVRP